MNHIYVEGEVRVVSDGRRLDIYCETQPPPSCQNEPTLHSEWEHIGGMFMECGCSLIGGPSNDQDTIAICGIVQRDMIGGR